MMETKKLKGLQKKLFEKYSQIDIEPVEYSEEEMKYRDYLIRRLDSARNQKLQKYTELDDMDYETWYWLSKKNNEAYLEPRLNEEDVRIVTGTTREKTNSLLATLLNYNLEVDITAFDDEDNQAEEIAQVMEAMVRKSRDLEEPSYETKRPLVYKELIGQGNVGILERFEQTAIPEKEIGDDFDDPMNAKWKNQIAKVYGRCNTQIVTGLDMFPGNIREFYMEKQPYFVVRMRKSRADIEAAYGGWSRYKHVPYVMSRTVQDDEQYGYNDYQMIETEVDFVEEIWYFDKWKNEMMLMLNGVMMFPVGMPLSFLLGRCGYPIAKGDAEPISHNFFFSRGIGNKVKMDQAIMDEMFKMMIIKTRKSFKPPMANNSQMNIGPEVYMPGVVLNGLNPDELMPIGDHTGVTQSEFNMMQFIQSVIDNKTVSPLLEGASPGSGATAREVVERMKQTMVKIGLPMLGVINLESKMAWLRIHNILRNWTKPIDSRIEVVTKYAEDGSEYKEEEEVNKYRSITVDDEFENGRNGQKIIEMTDQELPTDEQVEAEEDIIKYYTGRDVRKVYLDAKALASLRYKWHVSIEPTEKDSGLVKAAKFEESVTKAIQIFAPMGKQPNIDYLAERWAIVNNENPERFWQQQQPAGMPGMFGAMAQGQQAPPQMAAAQGGAPGVGQQLMQTENQPQQQLGLEQMLTG